MFKVLQLNKTKKKVRKNEKLGMKLLFEPQRLAMKFVQWKEQDDYSRFE